MADTTSDAKKRDREAPRKKKAWAWHPPLPLAGVPVFVFPPKPVKALKWFLSVGSLWSIQVPFVVLAVVTWFYLQPALERCVTFEAGWMLQMLARNLGLMVLVAGGLHLFFYTFKMQGAEHKYDPRDLNRNDRRYFGQNQVWDNIFWSSTRSSSCGAMPTTCCALSTGTPIRCGSRCCSSRSRSGIQCTSTSCIACCIGCRFTGSLTRCITGTSMSGRGRVYPCTRSSTSFISAAS
jgi:hypothetical protein